MDFEFNKLKKGLDLAVVKNKTKNGYQTSSIAYSFSGKSYIAGNIASDTHLLDITSEQAALCLAIHNNDFKINRIVTMAKDCNPLEVTFPIIAKVLIDHKIRTGTDIEYYILNEEGNVIFHTNNISKNISNYVPSEALLQKVKNLEVSSNCINFLDLEGDKKLILKKYASLGVERNFPTYDSASGYGVSILTNQGNLYFGGQYSSFEKRLNLHAEMAVAVDVLMSKKSEKITDLGLISTKYEDEPCEMCGCCRQFFQELSGKLKFDIKFYCFAKSNDKYNEYSIKDLIPQKWSSKCY